ncbi:LysM peptidoglycan-binding domain-containing protein [Methylocapsa polymorpha]|uniref:LysM peptidoglycan-binding domain-containing protein n=1 Tax=Methylocapsa polymorpha TaxID=3080828 RepID=A0ABZ0HPD5_9HYPH|nr:LysM peptidoglycan-binding domain-containing protein [Methylocapsa sp. RX1]
MRLKATALLLGFCFAVLLLVGSGFWRSMAPVKFDWEAPGAAQDGSSARIASGGDAAREKLPLAIASALPQFDIVRVEPSGETVVAGRALPDAKVALMSGSKTLAEGLADSAGFFVLQPRPLPPGDYALKLRMRPRIGDLSISLQSVAVSVPEKGKGQVMVALAEPGAATVLLSDPTAEQAVEVRRAISASDASAFSRVAFKTAEVEPNGGFFTSGVAKPGAVIRLYLNDAPLSDVATGADGRWSLKLAKSLPPGRYALRADEIDQSNAAVVSRAEIPFEFPAAAPPARPGSAALRDADAAAGQAETATVQRGDSLWRLSRKILGKGVHYTEIYAANASQIRDPHKIYPGQIFVMPKDHEP